MINNYLDNLEGLIIRVNPIRKGVHHNPKILIYLLKIHKQQAKTKENAKI